MKKVKRNVDCNKPIDIKLTSTWDTIKIDPYNQLCSTKSTESLMDIPKNIMHNEEIQEKHLIEAIKHNSSIPVPDINEITDEEYDKLYPANYSIPKIRIMIQPDNEVVEYDADSEDDEWLKENGQMLNLTYADFEKFMEYLENKSANSKMVPTIHDLTNYFNIRHATVKIVATYDYWLNKRLKSNGSTLMYSLKKEVPKANVKNRYDPYVAFRPCRERMHLRKNRARDYENYMKMLEMRDQFEESLKFHKTNALCEQTKHELLKLRFATFQDQYHTKGFNSSYLEKEVMCNTEFLLNDLKERRIGNDAQREDSETKTSDDVEPNSEENPTEIFAFSRKPGSDYYQPLNDFSEPEVPENQRFYSTDNGIFRQRIGRGGRLIYDRTKPSTSSQQVPEYQHVDLCQNIYVKRCDSALKKNASTSLFHLNSLPTIEPAISLDDIEVICSFDK